MSVIDTLLNSESQALAANRMEIEYIPRYNIQANEKNKDYSMDGIAELAQSIKLNGLEQPLVVKRSGEDFVILSGHRRFAAIEYLADIGDWSDAPIPCIVKNLSSVDLPVDDEIKEMLSLLSTNNTRKKTDADYLFEAREWKKIYTALRDAGVDCIPYGTDENGEEVKQQIAGVRTRELVAESLGVSPTQAAKIDKIENDGSDSLKEAIEDGRVSISAGAEMATLPKEKQDTMIDRGKTTLKEIKAEKAREPELPFDFDEEQEYEVSSEEFHANIKGIEDTLNDMSISLSSSEYFDYLSAIDKINRILGVGQNG